MEDLEYLKAAVAVMHKGSANQSGQPGENGQHAASGADDEQRLKWRRINKAANNAYGELRAHTRRSFRLPETSGNLLEIPDAVFQQSRGKLTYPDITTFLQQYLEPVADHDEKSRALVSDYIARMQDLVAQSRIVVSGAPPIDSGPNQAPGAASELEMQFLTALSLIGGAKDQLVALGDFISRNARAYVPRKTYETLRDDWNALQKQQDERDNRSAVSLIEAISDLRHLYGAGQPETSTQADESQAIFARAVNALTLRLETLLESNYAITRIPITEGTPFDTRIMTVDTSHVEPTSNSGLVGTVAQVVDNGYWRNQATEPSVVFQRARVIRYGAADRQRR